MKHSQRHVLLAAALATGVAFAMPPTQAAAFAGDNVAAADPGFIPNTGQINPGFDQKVPTMSEARPDPDAGRSPRGEADAGFRSTGCRSGPQDANANATTGSASAAATPVWADRRHRADHAGEILQA